jgi:photosystem II stability/assembly factor-like uncharacterized protein
MKKGLTIIILMLAVFVLSGCGTSTTISSPPTNTTYAVSKSLWKSTDGGTTWTAKDKSKDKLPVTDLDVLNIVINPSNSQNILASFKFGGYIKSNDGMDTWEKTNFVLERAYGLAFDPSNTTVIYASGIWQGRGKLFKIKDGEESWEETFTASSNGPFVTALAIDSKNSNIIYASTSDNQMMKSEDAGISWKNIYQAASPIVKIALDRANTSLIYAITLSGKSIRSKDGGVTFEDIKKNMSGGASLSVNQEYKILETDPQNASWLYLAGKGGIIRSKDAGDTWEKIVTLNDPNKFPVTAIAINPKNSQELIYGASQATYKSIDGGVHWITSQFNTAKFISIIKYDPFNPQIIYIGLKKQ